MKQHVNDLKLRLAMVRDISVNELAVSMATWKKCSMMLSETERVWGEQLRETSEARRLAWPGVQCPGNHIQLFLREAAEVAAQCYCLIHPVVLVVIYDTLNIGKVVRHFPVVF